MTQLFRILCKKYPLLRRFFCRSVPLVYADNDTLMHAPLSKKAVLVLPPSDYWTLRANLNVNSEKEAAKYGPALFDLGNEYRYDAQRAGENSYILIAYNPNEVAQKLHTFANFSIIEKITFAQWVFADAARPIRLNNGKYLTTLDGIVIEMDSPYVQADSSISLSEALASPNSFFNTVQIEGLVKSGLTPKTLKTTLIILLIFFGNLVAEVMVTHQESNRLREKTQEILNESKLPETSIERGVILDSLKTKETQQLRFRHLCKQISDIPLDVQRAPLPVTPVITTVPSVSTDGIVLIPGSKPGEANRLLVENRSSSATIDLHGEGIQELVYDGHAINLLIDTHDHSAGAKLKSEVLKRFKKAHVNEQNNQLEVRLK